jgi:hypothetical protein
MTFRRRFELRSEILGIGLAAFGTSLLFTIADAPSAYAQSSVDVPALIKLAEQKPEEMDRGEWKEKRRDAARKLAASKDKRAVPVLSKIAAEETFDIIGEIAIEGLGQIGDSSAAPTLQKIAADASRDKKQRDLATKALGRLGVKPTVTEKPIEKPVEKIPLATEPLQPSNKVVPTPVKEPVVTEPSTPPVDTATEPTTPPDTGLAAGGLGVAQTFTGETVAAITAPEFTDDNLAITDRLTFAIGGASLGYDSVRKRTAFNADVAASYARRVEQTSRAYGYGGDARVVTGYINPDGPSKSKGAQVVLSGGGEYRFYGGPGLYGVGRGKASAQLTYLSIVQNDPNDDPFKDVRTAADLGLALGVGYGRVVDMGSRIAVTRIEQALRNNRALGKSIDDATAVSLQRIWWSHRKASSGQSVLLATVAALRAAGVLLGEPDVATTYEILNVLRDPQLVDRFRGFDIDLTFGESYLVREDTPENPMVDKGRVEQIFLRGQYGRQLSDNLDLGGEAFARLRVLAAENTPAPYAAGIAATLRRFTYNSAGDPIGTIDARANAAISNDDRMDTNAGLSVGAELGFTYWLNQASGLRVAANASFDSGELFIGAKIDASYGLLRAAIAR